MSYFCELFQWNVTLKAQMKGIYQSGQMGQTVNLLVNAYGGSNPSVPTIFVLPGVLFTEEFSKRE
jgi:Mlc titration factor MtfA (ptsG expression regulator)